MKTQIETDATPPYFQKQNITNHCTGNLSASLQESGEFKCSTQGTTTR